jgi:hypothetical protein
MSNDQMTNDEAELLHEALLAAQLLSPGSWPLFPLLPPTTFPYPPLAAAAKLPRALRGPTIHRFFRMPSHAAPLE